MKRFIISVYLLMSLAACGQEFTFKLGKVDKDYYTWITTLEEGPTNWLDKPVNEVYGFSYRFVITTSEIYNQLFIEKVTYGDEGSGKKLIIKREIPIDEMFDKLALKGERAGVEFIKWIDSTSFIIRVQKQNFLISDIGNETIRIQKK
jgi:hypothetical protein